MDFLISDPQRVDYRENGYLIIRDGMPADESLAPRRLANAKAV